MNFKNKLLLILSLLMVFSFPATASAKYIQRVLMDCPSSLKASQNGYCNVKILYSDNTTGYLSRYSMRNWKTTNKNAVSVSSGRVTGQRTTRDSNATITAEYYVSGRSSPYVGFDVVKVIGSVNPFTNFYISCPPRTNENKKFNCSAYATISGRKTNVTNQTSWKDKSRYVANYGKGSFKAGNVNSNTGANISGTYSYQKVSRSDDKYITIVNGYTPPPPKKYLTKVTLSCPKSLLEGSGGQCTGDAKFSNGTTAKNIPLKNCKGTNSYASITSSGRVTARQVTGNKSYSLECSYTYSGKTMAGVGVIQIKDKTPKGLTAFVISCPKTINENTKKQCNAFATIDGKIKNVTSKTLWQEYKNYASIGYRTGLFSAGNVSSDSGVYVKAWFNYGGVYKNANTIVTVKNVLAPPPVTSATINIVNRYTNALIKLNGNSEWDFKKVVGDTFSFCEKKRPTYCLNTLYGNLRSTKVDPENSRYAQWRLETVGAYKKIRNVARSTYYIHHERSTVQAGYIQSGWWSAQWKMEEVKNVITPKDSSPIVEIDARYPFDKKVSIAFGESKKWVVEKITGTGFVIFRSKKDPLKRLYVKNNTLHFGYVGKNLKSAQWKLEKIGEFYKIKSVSSGLYIHAETRELTLGYIQSGWWSAQWKIKTVGTSFKSKEYGNIEMHLMKKVASSRKLSRSNLLASRGYSQYQVAYPVKPNVANVKQLVEIALAGGDLSNNKIWQSSKAYNKNLVIEAMTIVKNNLYVDEAKRGEELLNSTKAAEIKTAIILLQSSLNHFDQGRAWTGNTVVFSDLERSMIIYSLKKGRKKLEHTLYVIGYGEVPYDKRCHIDVTGNIMDTVECVFTDQIPEDYENNEGLVGGIKAAISIGYEMSPIGSAIDCAESQDLACLSPNKKLLPILKKIPYKLKFNIEAKIAKQMTKRGWSEQLISSTINSPHRTAKTRDTRWNSNSQTKRNDPATAYIRKDESYVVRNDVDGTIVQISDINDPSWKSPFN